jgi:hypothetical protein
MNIKKVIYMFFTLMSLTTIAGFLFDPNSTTLFIAGAVNIISTILKIGVNNTLSAELLASSLVADLHLVPAFFTLAIYHQPTIALSLVIGALIANLFAVLLIIVESAQIHTKEEY